MKIRIYPPAGLCELGKRPNQEDALFPSLETASEQDYVFVLCDGMGGHADGEKASRIVADALGCPDGKGEDFTVGDFDRDLDEAYKQLDAADNGEARKMGTTFCYARFNRLGCLVAHMGDSRIYHIRPGEWKILYKSKDHSLVQSLYDLGEITLEEMKNHPQKNIVTRVMQPNLGIRHKPEIRQLTDIQEGDIIYMCTDGMLERMEDEELVRIFSDAASDGDQLVRTLREATEGNKDNHSAWIIRVRGVEESMAAPEVMPVSGEAPVRQTHARKKWFFPLLLMFIVAFLICLLYNLFF